MGVRRRCWIDFHRDGVEVKGRRVVSFARARVVCSSDPWGILRRLSSMKRPVGMNASFPSDEGSPIADNDCPFLAPWSFFQALRWQ